MHVTIYSFQAPETARWKTEVHIVCDLSKGVGRARPLDVALRHGRACTLELVWESQHGCPLCRLSDYKTMGGNCLEGYMVRLNFLLYFVPETQIFGLPEILND